MKRSKLIQLLQAYSPASEEELARRAEMLRFIESHEDCFERSLEVGHITASSWLLSKDGTTALLMHHAKLNLWCQLGGHCDGNPDVLDVALKEAREESGITQIHPASDEIFDIDIHLIPENSREKSHYHYDVRFLLQVASDEKIIRNPESKELRWVGKNKGELPTQELSVVRMFDKWINFDIWYHPGTALLGSSPKKPVERTLGGIYRD